MPHCIIIDLASPRGREECSSSASAGMAGGIWHRIMFPQCLLHNQKSHGVFDTYFKWQGHFKSCKMRCVFLLLHHFLFIKLLD